MTTNQPDAPTTRPGASEGNRTVIGAPTWPALVIRKQLGRSTPARVDETEIEHRNSSNR